MSKNKEPLWLDGILGSQLRDTQGEILSVEGADISELQAGRGRWNDNHAKGFVNTLGTITEAKKILSEKDCTNDRHKYYWDKIKAPYIYGKGYLFDNEDHPNARACAAILRNIHKADSPLKLKLSVEGGVLQRGIGDNSLLARTKIHSCAITFTPANNATLVEPVNLSKNNTDSELDMILIKSVMHLAETEIPSFRHIERVASAEKIRQKMTAIDEMVKNAQNPELEKNWKNIAASAATLGALALAPQDAAQEQPKQAQPKVEQKKDYASGHRAKVDGLKGRDPALYSLAHVESSLGKRFDDHAVMQSGMHKGHQAAGPWGLMPKTIGYAFKVSKDLSKKYPEIADKLKDVEANHGDITKVINSNPDAAADISSSLFGHLKKVHGGDLDKAVHSWHYGIGGTKKRLESDGEEGIKNSEYVQKFKSHFNDLEKALTAGYGGAGSPSNLIGGGVMMAAELDVGKGFKYVTCDHCGGEQVYHKFQTKCRKTDCGHSFSLEKMYQAMTKK